MIIFHYCDTWLVPLTGQPVGSILRLHAAGYSSALVSRSSLHLLYGRSRLYFCKGINKSSPPKCVFYYRKQPPLEGITIINILLQFVNSKMKCRLPLNTKHRISICRTCTRKGQVNSEAGGQFKPRIETKYGKGNRLSLLKSGKYFVLNFSCNSTLQHVCHLM